MHPSLDLLQNSWKWVFLSLFLGDKRSRRKIKKLQPGQMQSWDWHAAIWLQSQQSVSEGPASLSSDWSPRSCRPLLACCPAERFHSFDHLPPTWFHFLPTTKSENRPFLNISTPSQLCPAWLQGCPFQSAQAEKTSALTQTLSSLQVTTKCKLKCALLLSVSIRQFLKYQSILINEEPWTTSCTAREALCCWIFPRKRRQQAKKVLTLFTLWDPVFQISENLS